MTTPTQYRCWVVNDAPDLTASQYTGLKSQYPLIDIDAYAILDDNVIADFNLPSGGVWVDTFSTLPETICGSQLVVLDGYIYLFGGKNSNKIFYAPTFDPCQWIDTGTVLPSLLSDSSLAVVGDTIFLFGGNDGYNTTNKIFSAPVSNPLSWIDAGSTLPVPLQNSSLGMYNGNIYLFGGQNDIGAVSSIFVAPISNPINWINSGSSLPDPLFGSHFAQIDGYFMLFGGQGNDGYISNRIYQAPNSNPLSWAFDGYMPHPLSFGQFIVVGDQGYIVAPMIGNVFDGMTPIVQCNTNAPNAWLDIQVSIPGQFSQGSMAIINDRIWLFGGNGSSAIFSCDQYLKYNYYQETAVAYGNNTRNLIKQIDTANNPFLAVGVAYWITDYQIV